MHNPGSKRFHSMMALLMMSAWGTAVAGSAQRWLNADTGLLPNPDPQALPKTALLRGTEVAFRWRMPDSDYCLIESTGFFGYVRCETLGQKPPASTPAAAVTINASTRWVSTANLRLRSQARADAPVLSRLGFNAPVQLLSGDSDGDYCEVRSERAGRGYVACRYLAEAPEDENLLLSLSLANGQPNPRFDPVRAFWIQPSWERLEVYAQALADRHRQSGVDANWPRDEDLEQMKAELAKGLFAPAPPALPDWAEMKALAAASRNPQTSANTSEAATAEEFERLRRQILINWPSWLGLWGESFNALDGKGPVYGLVEALEFPAAVPSWFRSEQEVAPPEDTARVLSGRFGIVYRWLTKPRPVAATDENYGTPGLYDMLSRTQVLVRAVQRVRLYRDGHLDSKATHARSSETLWRDTDEPMCNGWEPGFRFGASDAAIWRYFDDVEFREQARARATRRPGSLYEFIVPTALPHDRALVSLREYPMDRSATGFIHGSELAFDFDHDNHPDLLVWEGTGHGPGHMDGETTTDDAWYRLVLVNINGRWKILGTDSFSYGCG
jgi:hypothetical protein